MIVLSGAHLVLPDRVIAGGTLVLDGDRIADVLQDSVSATDLPPVTVNFSFPDHYIVPGFIDVHVHGVEGIDTLDGGAAIATMAERLPAYGVTAFCPTSIACDPSALRQMLAGVRLARTARPPGGARVLPAHLESNFINPEFKGAQPLACLRGVRPGSDGGQTGRRPGAGGGRPGVRPGSAGGQTGAGPGSDPWPGGDPPAEIPAARPDVGIV